MTSSHLARWFNWQSAAPVSQRSWVRIPFKPKFFSGLIFATAQVAYVTVMIFHLFIVCSVVQIYDFHIFIIISSPKRVHIERIHSHGQQPCKFTGTKECFYIRKEFNSHRTGLVHQHGRHFIVLVHQYGCRDVMCIRRIELTERPAPSWLDGSIGRVLHRYRRGHGFVSRSSLNFFQA